MMRGELRPQRTVVEVHGTVEECDSGREVGVWVKYPLRHKEHASASDEAGEVEEDAAANTDRGAMKAGRVPVPAWRRRHLVLKVAHEERSVP